MNRNIRGTLPHTGERRYKITTRIPADLHAKLQQAADAESRSINSYIVNLLYDTLRDR